MYPYYCKTIQQKKLNRFIKYISSLPSLKKQFVSNSMENLTNLQSRRCSEPVLLTKKKSETFPKSPLPTYKHTRSASDTILRDYSDLTSVKSKLDVHNEASGGEVSKPVKRALKQTFSCVLPKVERPTRYARYSTSEKSVLKSSNLARMYTKKSMDKKNEK